MDLLCRKSLALCRTKLCLPVNKAVFGCHSKIRLQADRNIYKGDILKNMNEETDNVISDFETDRVHRNLPVPQLIEHSLARGEGTLTPGGALVVYTGKYTGRSPDDKFIADTPSVHDEIWWGNGQPGFFPGRVRAALCPDGCLPAKQGTVRL